jgi:antirestriction protein
MRINPNLNEEKKMSEEIKIYVACLAAYNSGYLHGVWIDATQEPEDIQAEIQTMLKASPIPEAEEYAIHDYDGFGSVSLSEYASIEKVHNLALFIEEHNDLGRLVLEHFCGDLDEATKALDEQYLGQYASLADYAEESYCGEIPSGLAYYIDWEAMARDMELNGSVFSIQEAHDCLHVFIGY